MSSLPPLSEEVLTLPPFSASPAAGESIRASGIPVSLGGGTWGEWVAGGNAGAAKVPTGGQMMAPRAGVVVEVIPG